MNSKAQRTAHIPRSLAIALCAIVSGLAAANDAFGENLTWQRWGTVSPSSLSSSWSFASGDFNGDGAIDVAAYNPSDGNICIGTNTVGTGGQRYFRVSSPWATVSPSAGWTLLAGQFTGDSRMDLFAYHPSDGSIWVFRNTGSSFVFERWATVSPASGWNFATGDFTGDGRLDVVGYHSGDGTVWVGTQKTATNGQRYFDFGATSWVTFEPANGWIFQAGDFTKDGYTDIVGYHSSDGSIYIGRNTRTNSFSWSQWATIDTGVPSSMALVPGDFVGDGNLGLGIYFPTDGSFWVARKAGDSFVVGQWSSVDPRSDWKFTRGGFSQSSRLDLFAYHPSDGSLWVGVNNGPAPEGYAWPLSAARGETIAFKASGYLNPTVHYYRYGKSGNGVLMQPSSTISSVRVQPLSLAQPFRNGCDWITSFTLTIPATWTSGLYSARLISAVNGDSFDITFVVKPSPSRQSRVAVIANVNTWNAYNNWGGKSKYGGAALTSFLRPNPYASPVIDDFPGSHLARAERWILGWFNDNGYKPDLYTDIDFHNRAVTYAEGYRKIVIGTHPEYWTKGMSQNLKAFLDAGGSVVYLGGDAMFEVVSYHPDSTHVTYLNGVESGDRTPALFRVMGLHERELLGVATARCTTAGDWNWNEDKRWDGSGAGYKVVTPVPSVPGTDVYEIFKLTGLQKNSVFGNTGLNTGGVSHSLTGGASAHEIDTSYDADASHIPCRIAANITNIASIAPSNLILLAEGQNPDGGAHMTFYRHRGGGFVFSAGSITFGGSLAECNTPAECNQSPVHKLIKNVMNLN